MAAIQRLSAKHDELKARLGRIGSTLILVSLKRATLQTWKSALMQTEESSKLRSISLQRYRVFSTSPLASDKEPSVFHCLCASVWAYISLKKDSGRFYV
jgi:hypothetical protein